jgi:hypothetical protein
MLGGNERPLLEWARRLESSSGGGPNSLRQTLEATLVPMIRCALRNGTGQLNLVRWVQNQLPLLDPTAGPNPDPARYAGAMARVLCERLMERLEPPSGCETVVGP